MTTLILVVDDEPDLETLIQQKFRHKIRDGALGFIFARDGLEALSSLESNQNVDLVITDINMPRMDGYGFIEQVRKHPRNKAVPILVLTTESEASKKERAKQAGATGWIVKPFDPAKLISAINRVSP